MKHLVYCIYEKKNGRPAEEPFAGVDGHSVHEVEADGLAAAVSRITATGLSADLAAMTSYHEVIDHFHRRCTVIPLRFGTLLDNELEVERLLQSQRNRYKKLLEELHGRTEMGIRVIVPDRTQAPEIVSGPAQFVSEPRTPGLSYLTSRKARYVACSHMAEKDAEKIKVYTAAFAGMYSRTKSETSGFGQNNDEPEQSPLLSLYFLIPRDSLEDFRRAFERLKSREPVKMLLSGPWPPYNFVLPSSEAPHQDPGRLSA